MRQKYQNFSVALHYIGYLLLILGVFLIIPLIFVLIYQEFRLGSKTSLAFITPAILSIGLGFLFKSIFSSKSPNKIQATLICSLSWIFFSAIGAIPFVIAINSSYLDAYFETMSGFTTTGITMYSGLDFMPKSILFWRSFIQWIGGLGILTFFLAIISMGGAHQLFSAESHKISTGRPVPGLFNTVKILWGIYSLFTLIIMTALILSGCSFFDSLCHSFTTLSTGGFSLYDASIEYYSINGFKHFKLIEYILIFGMFLGGTNFLIHFRLFKKDWKAIFDTIEMKFWLGFIIIFSLIITFETLHIDPITNSSDIMISDFWKKIENNFRTSLFQVVSIASTTGFGTKDINHQFFGHVARQIFLVLMFIGGCVGSTGGGFKMLRVGVLFNLIRREVFRIFVPDRAISYVVIDGKNLEKDEIFRIAGLFFAWVSLLLLGGLITASLSKYNGYQSISGMFSALGNIGPCFIPVSELHLLHPFIKITYIFGMLAGRLEILPILILFSSKLWK